METEPIKNNISIILNIFFSLRNTVSKQKETMWSHINGFVGISVVCIIHVYQVSITAAKDKSFYSTISSTTFCLSSAWSLSYSLFNSLIYRFVFDIELRQSFILLRLVKSKGDTLSWNFQMPYCAFLPTGGSLFCFKLI